HQLRGLRWLQKNFLQRRGGCLLADDMGLGKTLQILCFLAWLIEEGRWPETGPWNPILVVAPITFLYYEGAGLKNAREYFEDEGAIFRPILRLHGTNLKKLRAGKGKETELGAPVLDLDLLRQHRVILTNYETVTNFQHSFARLQVDLSVVVTDESQE